MNTELEQMSPAELSALHDVLLKAIEQMDRNVLHFRRLRLFLAWGGLALAAASTAALFVAENVVQFTLGGMQAALWIVIALMNFGGPSVTELLAKCIRKRP